MKEIGQGSSGARFVTISIKVLIRKFRKSARAALEADL